MNDFHVEHRQLILALLLGAFGFQHQLFSQSIHLN